MQMANDYQQAYIWPCL